MPLTDGPRVVSLLPSATDIMAALGAGDLLVGVSHGCDDDWAYLPVLTSTLIDKNAPACYIDAQVKNSCGQSVETAKAATGNLPADLDIHILDGAKHFSRPSPTIMKSVGYLADTIAALSR